MAMATISTMVHIRLLVLKSSTPPMDKLMLFPISTHTKVISINHLLHLPVFELVFLALIL